SERSTHWRWRRCRLPCGGSSRSEKARGGAGLAVVADAAALRSRHHVPGCAASLVSGIGCCARLDRFPVAKEALQVSSIWLAVIGLSAFFLGYRFYAKFIAQRIYRLDPDFVTPAHEFPDGVD